MSDIYAGAHTHLDGECAWASHYDDCFVGCSAPVFPGEPECVDHFIAAAHRRADLEAATRLIPRKGNPAA